MPRVLFLMAIAFCVPFLLYAAYRALRRSPGEALWTGAPFDWLTITGALTAIVTIATFIVVTNA